jgi:hypothetical protein
VQPVVLNVGCGKGRIDTWLSQNGYVVYATDYKTREEWVSSTNLLFSEADIYKLSSFPIRSAPIVLCSEVLEHLVGWKGALKNLLELTETRLIITVPWRRSFNDSSPPPVGHCNFWMDEASDDFRDIREFEELCRPYSVSISKIRTKPRDMEMRQRSYLITVDKRQKWDATALD